MALLAGIDEAGLGPLLGPLVVTGVAFEVPDAQLDRCLWDALRASCTDRPQTGRNRLAIADSKKLYSQRRNLAALERPALVMLAAAGHRLRSWRSLLDQIAPGAVSQLDEYPWYAGADPSLPTSEDVGDVGTQSNALRRDCAGGGVALQGVYGEPVTAGRFNQLIEKTQNKSVVSLGLTLRVVARILDSSPAATVRIHIDRLGGRTHYRDPLMTAFPAYRLQILEESPHRSGYRLRSERRTCDIEFITKGEDRHFVVALASIYSKYVRELYMRAFNTYWCNCVEGLRPTAGYYSDAKRWLRESASEIKRRSIDRALLVRQR